MADYTDTEIREAVWQATLGVDAGGISRMGGGRHSQDSIFMLLLNMVGKLPNGSVRAMRIAEELDAEPRFAGWREDVLAWAERQSW
jgi:hypothetical protein